MAIVFEPEHGAHALIESVFFASFKSKVDEEDLADSIRSNTTITKMLPTQDLMKKIELKITPEGGQTTNPVTSGIEISDKDSEGKIKWLARSTPDNLSIHCLDYSRWDFVWEKMYSIFEEILSSMGGEVEIISFGLKNVDKFRFTKDLADYRFSDLFDERNAFISSNLMTAGPLWHNHTGWFDALPFDETSPGGRILNQLNVASAEESVDQGSNLFFRIEHNLTVQVQNPCHMPNNEFKLWLVGIIQELHQKNKLLIGNILSEAMVERISLTKEVVQ